MVKLCFHDYSGKLKALQLLLLSLYAIEGMAQVEYYEAVDKFMPSSFNIVGLEVQDILKRIKDIFMLHQNHF